MRRSLLSLVALVLSACGGAGPSPRKAAPPPADLGRRLTYDMYLDGCNHARFLVQPRADGTFYDPTGRDTSFVALCQDGVMRDNFVQYDPKGKFYAGPISGWVDERGELHMWLHVMTWDVSALVYLDDLEVVARPTVPGDPTFITGEVTGQHFDGVTHSRRFDAEAGEW